MLCVCVVKAKYNILCAYCYFLDMEDTESFDKSRYVFSHGNFITLSTSKICMTRYIASRPRGLMDKASDFGSEDSRFEFWWGRLFLKLAFELKREICSIVEIILKKEFKQVTQKYSIYICF